MKGFDSVPKLQIKTLLKALVSRPLPPHKYTFNYVRSAFDFLLKNLKLEHRRLVVPEFICPIIEEVCRRNNIETITVPPDPKTYNLDLNELENFREIDYWVNTACQRIEGKNIINLEDLPK